FSCCSCVYSLSSLSAPFFLHCFAAPRHLHSFPTRRSSDLEELEFLGIRDYFEGNALCLIEWPQRGAGVLPKPDLDITISPQASRSEEHTSELQSRENLVCRLLLEKKKAQEHPKKAIAQ